MSLAFNPSDRAAALPNRCITRLSLVPTKPSAAHISGVILSEGDKPNMPRIEKSSLYRLDPFSATYVHAASATAEITFSKSSSLKNFDKFLRRQSLVSASIWAFSLLARVPSALRSAVIPALTVFIKLLSWVTSAV